MQLINVLVSIPAPAAMSTSHLLFTVPWYFLLIDHLCLKNKIISLYRMRIFVSFKYRFKYNFCLPIPCPNFFFNSLSKVHTYLHVVGVSVYLI